LGGRAPAPDFSGGAVPTSGFSLGTPGTLALHGSTPPAGVLALPGSAPDPFGAFAAAKTAGVGAHGGEVFKDEYKVWVRKHWDMESANNDALVGHWDKLTEGVARGWFGFGSAEIPAMTADERSRYQRVRRICDMMQSDNDKVVVFKLLPASTPTTNSEEMVLAVGDHVFKLTPQKMEEFIDTITAQRRRDAALKADTVYEDQVSTKIANIHDVFLIGWANSKYGGDNTVIGLTDWLYTRDDHGWVLQMLDLLVALNMCEDSGTIRNWIAGGAGLDLHNLKIKIALHGTKDAAGMQDIWDAIRIEGIQGDRVFKP
jgi:hypothetical protein